MSEARITQLSDRGAVAVNGADAEKFLNGLLTNEISQLKAGEAAHAGLLSPQGKILFDFHAVRTPEGFLLQTAAEKTGDLVKRLSMYKLRANVAILDVSDQFTVLALWGDDISSPGETAGTVSFIDSRHAALGRRILAEERFAADIAGATNGMTACERDYHAHRIALGVPEGGKDYAFGDAYPHEADFDLFNGVSFTKGCYVGQEIVARMQHKTAVRKRVVRVEGAGDLSPGAGVTLDSATTDGVTIGTIGSVDGRKALAMMRLDRVAEARARQTAIVANGVVITVDSGDMSRFTAAAAARGP